LRTCAKTSTLSKLISTALLLTAVAASSEAFGQGPTFDSDTYKVETVTVLTGGIREPRGPLETESSYSEYRKQGILLKAWRATNNQVLMSFDDLPAFTVGTTPTKTLFAPVVVPWDAGGPDAPGTAHFLVFHTGVDGRIYYTDLFDKTNATQHSGSGQWQTVPGQSTKASVSVAEFDNRGDLFMVYQGAGSDDSVYGTWYDAQQGSWHFIGNIGGGQTLSAPSITYNSVSNELFIVARGLDQAVWSTHQQVGATTWGSWTSLQRTTPMKMETVNSPQILANTRGLMVISYVDPNGNPWYQLFDKNLNPVAGWTQDLTHWQTSNPVSLTADGDIVYSLLTGLDGNGWWKKLIDTQGIDGP
jgi:hypothetical protein